MDWCSVYHHAERRVVDNETLAWVVSNLVYVLSHVLSLVEQAQKFPNLLPLGDLQRSMNRLILYQVSTIPSSEADQKSLMETFCLFSGQAHVIFDDTNMDTEFLKYLTFQLMKIVVLAEDSALPSGHVPIMSLSMMKSANQLWNKMLEYKHKTLEQILSVKLSVPNPTHHDTTSILVSSQVLLHPTHTGPSSYVKLQNCSDLMTEQLEKVWNIYENRESVSL